MWLIIFSLKPPARPTDKATYISTIACLSFDLYAFQKPLKNGLEPSEQFCEPFWSFGVPFCLTIASGTRSEIGSNADPSGHRHEEQVVGIGFTQFVIHQSPYFYIIQNLGKSFGKFASRCIAVSSLFFIVGISNVGVYKLHSCLEEKEVIDAELNQIKELDTFKEMARKQFTLQFNERVSLS